MNSVVSRPSLPSASPLSMMTRDFSAGRRCMGAGTRGFSCLFRKDSKDMTDAPFFKSAGAACGEPHGSRGESLRAECSKTCGGVLVVAGLGLRYELRCDAGPTTSFASSSAAIGLAVMGIGRGRRAILGYALSVTSGLLELLGDGAAAGSARPVRGDPPARLSASLAGSRLGVDWSSSSSSSGRDSKGLKPSSSPYVNISSPARSGSRTGDTASCTCNCRKGIDTSTWSATALNTGSAASSRQTGFASSSPVEYTSMFSAAAMSKQI
mmetsp:Transcript_9440/g.24471  ORF Transcript_9440/g.24471 Transcript_9440/m.24471 type:complete len:267 (+) Transcript_9440:769-1569(+)